MRRAYRDMLTGALWCLCVLVVGASVSWLLWELYRWLR